MQYVAATPVRRWYRMAQVSIEDWTRYYDRAQRLREALGGDELARYVRRRNARERALFAFSCVVLLAVAFAFLFV